MKSCGVALQKYLGGDALHSLRDLEPNLSFPRLINGLPSIIPGKARRAIREGSIGYIRFYLTLFYLFRILKCPFKVKLDTITTPYSGDTEFLKGTSDVFLKYGNCWLPIGIHPSQLVPTHFYKSTKASPNMKLS